MRSNLDLNLLLAIAFIVFFLFSCSKQGPAGLAGATGATGAAGPQGPTGPQGDTGTANVIYSAWLDVKFTADTSLIGNTIDTLGFFANVAALKLDSAMISNGEMKVYLNLGTVSAPAVVTLPYLDVNTGISITPTFKLNNILLYANTDASTTTQNGQKYLQYRYIMIPGGNMAGGRLAHPPAYPDWNNYNAVKAFYGLKD